MSYFIIIVSVKDVDLTASCFVFVGSQIFSNTMHTDLDWHHANKFLWIIIILN